VSVKKKLLDEGFLLMLGMCEILYGFGELLCKCETWSVALRDSIA
jgi:hypothetical protein